ncbi:hypothetical protein CPT_Percy15 [Caulobacter phage Percy]|uniref:Uncharacterized protein n=1 Tax=Caulobacter phage Percy TaxID=1701809 RepID=A0A0M3UKY4_9CAUD|nr:hypothetical protein CPT_Percy15 [Caulobacter phage Percy]ALF01649.1 hypothetical protein CPT_Percy15 [Caulobacter phage Percy]
MLRALGLNVDTADEFFPELHDCRSEQGFQPQSERDVMQSHGYDLMTPLDKFFEAPMQMRMDYAEALTCSDG